VGYKLEVESDGNLGIYSKPDLPGREIWIGSIQEPQSSNPVLALGTPLGILGVEKVLHLFKQWKARPHPASGRRKPSPKSEKCRKGTRKWRNAYRAGR